MENLNCTPHNFYNLSKFCTGYHENAPDNCIPPADHRRALGVWASIIAVIGVLGNMLTLLAIPYAAQKER